MELKDKRLFLLDMDGTIYLDDDLFDGTLDFLSEVKSKGGRYLFVTNNSSKSTDAYVRKLNRIGIDAKEEDFLAAFVAADDPTTPRVQGFRIQLTQDRTAVA